MRWSSVERKNGWQLADVRRGIATPDGVQRLLYNYRCDADLVRDDLKSYVVEHLSAADVLVVDETASSRKGISRLGCKYSGTAGRIENCHASARGRTLLDRELYLPQVWAEDWERRWGAGECFRTKPQLAQLMLKLESGVGWVAGDEVYGNDRKLGWSEREFPSWPRVWNQGLCQVRADRLTSLTSPDAVRAMGPRGHGCRRGNTPLGEPGKGYWLTCPARGVGLPRMALEELVRGAGTRWAIEECFEEAKGQVGLDQYEVRRWDGWYRHITLAMLAQAYLSVIKHQAMEPGEKGAATVPMKS